MTRFANVLLAIVAVWLVLLVLSWSLFISAVNSFDGEPSPFIVPVMLLLAAPLVACDWVGHAMGISWIQAFAVMVSVVALGITLLYWKAP